MLRILLFSPLSLVSLFFSLFVCLFLSLSSSRFLFLYTSLSFFFLHSLYLSLSVSFFFSWVSNCLPFYIETYTSLLLQIYSPFSIYWTRRTLIQYSSNVSIFIVFILSVNSRFISSLAERITISVHHASFSLSVSGCARACLCTVCSLCTEVYVLIHTHMYIYLYMYRHMQYMYVITEMYGNMCGKTENAKQIM